jgi:hypothetical protein
MIHALFGSWERLLTTVTLILAISSGLISIFLFQSQDLITQSGKVQHEQSSRDLAQDKQIEIIRSDLSEISSKLNKIESDIASISSNSQITADVQISSLGAIVNDLKGKLSNIEQAIINDPAKSLAIPLLKRDLDSLRDSSNSHSQSTKQEIERIYDMIKWFVGLMFTMTLGVITLAVSNFFKPKDSK